MALINLSEINLEVDSASTPMWSITLDGYRYVLYSTYKVLIFKNDAKEPSYEITPVGCSCPGDRYSNSTCKHRKIVSFLGDGSAAPPIEGTTVKAKQDSHIAAEPTTEVLYDMDDLFG